MATNTYIQSKFTAANALLVGSFVLSIFFGLLTSISWQLSIALLAGIICCIFILIYPIASIVVAIAFLTEAIPGTVSPKLGSFLPWELIVIGLTLRTFITSTIDRRSFFFRRNIFFYSLIYLFACLFVSLIYVKYYRPNDYFLAELRPFFAWLLLPLLCYYVNNKKKFNTLINVVICLALLVALFSIAQAIFGIKILATRSESLDMRSNSDITRSLAGGATYLLSFIIIYYSNTNTKNTAENYFQKIAITISIVALAISFGRGVWIATFIAYITSSLLNGGIKKLIKSVAFLTLAIMLLLYVVDLFNHRISDALIERVQGISSEVNSGGSFHWRELENSHAYTAITKNPFFGVGLGGEYKIRATPFEMGGFENETKYIHNSYIGLILKLGVQSILFPIFIVLSVIIYFFGNFKKIDLEWKPIFVAAFSSFIIPLTTSFTQPEWRVNYGIMTFVFFIFIILFIKENCGNLSKK